MRLINHGHGYRAFENGLSSASWKEISQSYGIAFRLQFVAPEQTGRLPAAPDFRTDLYCLGILFYVLLTGELPFASSTALETLQSLLSKRVPSVSSKRSDLPPAISAIVAKMVQRNIEDRYHSAHGLKADLDYVTKIFDQSLVDASVSLPDDWVAGEQDAKCVFRLPDLQVGREPEREKLLSVLAKVHKKRKQFTVSAQSAPQHESSYSMNGTSLYRTTSLTENSSDRASFRSTSTTSTGRGDQAVDGDDNSSNGNYVSINRDSIEGNSSITGPRSPVPSHETSVSAFSARASERIKRGSRTELIVVSGATGFGKSRLVQSVLPEARKRGFVAVAKFDSSSGTPFQPLIRLLSSLVRQIFMDTSDVEFHNNFGAFIKPSWNGLASMLSLPVDLLDSGVNGATKTVFGRHSPTPLGPIDE